MNIEQLYINITSHININLDIRTRSNTIKDSLYNSSSLLQNLDFQMWKHNGLVIYMNFI
jgi:hypothetical protein